MGGGIGMIVQMSKVYIAVRQADRDDLLETLGRMNLVHFQPVQPEEAVPDEETLQEIGDIDRALEILSSVSVKHAEKSPIQKSLDAAREVIQIQALIIDNQNRRKELRQRIEELKIWGHVSSSQFKILREAGMEVRFYAISQVQAREVRAECSEIISLLPGKRLLMALVDRKKEVKVPDGSEPILFPSQDRASILDEAHKVDMDLKQGYQRLSQLAALTGDLRVERDRLVSKTAFVKARRSGLSREKLFAVQGWLPSEKVEVFRSRLIGGRLHAAVISKPVTEEDVPPTLIRYPKWARPIEGLFDMLGTLPGYREMDLSPFFMLALPVFTAMLIGDAGYGLLISLVGLLFYKRWVGMAGRSKTQILVIFGLATLLWGILTANYFGVTPETMARAGGFAEPAETGGEVDYAALWEGTGFYSHAARMMRLAGLFWEEDPKAARFLLMKVALIIGCFHLILARFRKMVELIPNPRALAEAGWIIALADMLALIWYLLFVGVEWVPGFLWWILLSAVLLSSWFGQPRKGVLKRILLGLASSLLPLLNTFSDTMSYLRLFAVGLASYFIASAFNALSVQIAETATWFAAVPILIFGHALNIGLAAIAVFAHGVRLNMLEFSNNVGVQWGGYAYRPFFTGSVTNSGEELL
jgi:V/A-type H+-transporting ATPase subunit I